MPQNLKTAVVGLAFAVFAIAGYQYIYKVGIWKPNISTKAAIDNAIARADRVTAAQAKADLDALLSRAEKGERLDRAELERLIKAAATDAGSLDALYKEAETKSRGQIVAPPVQAAPPPVQQAPSGPSPVPQEPASAPAERVVPRPAPDQYFFDQRIELKDSHRQWTRISSPASLERFALVVDGYSELQRENRNQVKTVGPRGIEPTTIEVLNPNQMVSSSFMFLALLARTCSPDGCGDIRQFRENPWVICLDKGEWLELRLNVAIGSSFESNHSEPSIRATRSDSFCGGNQ